MLNVLSKMHKAIITVFLVFLYPNFAFVSLIAMAIRYKDFGTVKDWHRTWVDALKDVWRCDK